MTSEARRIPRGLADILWLTPQTLRYPAASGRG